MAFQKAVQKGGWLFWVFFFFPLLFLQGVSAISVCVFPHSVDPGQRGVCQEGKQLPEALTRVQGTLIQFTIAELLLTAFFWAPHSPPAPFKILFHHPLFLYYCSSWICHSVVARAIQKRFFENGSSTDVSENKQVKSRCAGNAVWNPTATATAQERRTLGEITKIQKTKAGSSTWANLCRRVSWTSPVKIHPRLGQCRKRDFTCWRKFNRRASSNGSCWNARWL